MPFTERPNSKCTIQAIKDKNGNVLTFEDYETAKKKCNEMKSCNLIVDDGCNKCDLTLCAGQVTNETDSSCTYKKDDGMKSLLIHTSYTSVQSYHFYCVNYETLMIII